MPRLLLTLSLAAASAFIPAAQEHDHPAPEKLGTVSFPTSCKPQVQPEFNRAVALLHSFSYQAADKAFHQVTQQDPDCAIAHWGAAMTHYHQLWDLPPSPTDTTAAKQEIDQASNLKSASGRELGLIRASKIVFHDESTVPYTTRAANYQAAMHQLALAYPKDPETQIFYALALISNASPSDRSHLRQKQAADLLEPLFRVFPDHPGIPHYLIHAYDNQELAPRGLAAARVYAGIARSAPHALHMPSHIFTRLGLWSDSISSNLAAKSAAHQQGDAGEELHAMDYLAYAYLQSGRDQEAAQLVQQFNTMQSFNMGSFKIGYAATAFPVRYIVDAESGIKQRRSRIHQVPCSRKSSQSQFGRAESASPGTAIRPRPARRPSLSVDSKYSFAHQEITYWANQVDIMRREVTAWSAQTAHRNEEAVSILRSAADDEDAVEKLPVTPGPILPAREQLGELFLEQGNFHAASVAFKTSTANTPNRRRGLHGATLYAITLSSDSAFR